MGQALARIGAGFATGGLSEVGLFAANAGKDILSGPKAAKQTPLEQRTETTAKQSLQSAKSRKDRLAQARGRSSFRIALGSTGADAGVPRQTRSGISIG